MLDSGVNGTFFTSSSAAGAFTVAAGGILQKNGTGGHSVQNAVGLTNSGTVEVNAGTFNVTGGVFGTNAGTVAVASGATFLGNITNNATAHSGGRAPSPAA